MTAEGASKIAVRTLRNMLSSLVVVGFVVLILPWLYFISVLLMIVVSATLKDAYAEQHHVRVKKFAETAFTRCSDGAQGVKMMTTNSAGEDKWVMRPYKWVMRPCSGPESTARHYAVYIRQHFDARYGGLGQTNLSAGIDSSPGRDTLYIFTRFPTRDLRDPIPEEWEIKSDRIVRE